MKHTTFLSAIVALTIATGCGSSSAENTSTVTPAAPATTIPAPAAGNVTIVQPATNSIATKAVIQTPQVNTNTVNAAGLNPAHGQPGHRCDISVGAPLNSQPNQPVVNNPTPQVVTGTRPSAVNVQPVAVTAGMNPQHGQPGHRCDIAVGAPLNSKPTQ